MGIGVAGSKRWFVAGLAVLAVAAAHPIGAVQVGSLVATPVGASGSTVYMSVSNTSTEPATASLNLSLTSGASTLVGSTNVAVPPLATVTVPVQMSGTVSLTKLCLSTQLRVGIIQDSGNPF